MSTLEPITVMRGTFGPCPGVRIGRVAAYDFLLREQDYGRPGADRRDRSYLLLDDHIQLSEPPGFPPEQAGWWYVDLVEITELGAEISVWDHYLDVIVGPPGHSYRLLDLHEFGDAIETGHLTTEQAVAGLRRFQHFLDTHLNRRHDITLEWPDFPPGAIQQLRDLPSFLEDK